MPTFDPYGNYLDDQGGIMIPAQAFGGGMPMGADRASGPALPPPALPQAAPAHAPFGLAAPPSPAGAAPAPAPGLSPGRSPGEGPALPPSPFDFDAVSGPATFEEDQADEQRQQQRDIENDPDFGLIGEPDRRRVPVISQWYDLEQKRNAMAKDLGGQLQTQQDADLKERQDAEQELAAWGEDDRAKLQSEMQEYSKARIDPMRVFHDASGWQQVSFVIGMAMGAIANPKTGKNPALEIAFHLIDKDIEAQKANLDAKANQFDQRKSLYAINLEAKRSDIAAKSLTRAQMLETLRQKLATDFEQTFSNDDLALNYTKAMDELEKAQAEAVVKAHDALMKDAAATANIDKTLAETSKLRTEGLKLEAETRKILAKLGGGGVASPTAATPSLKTGDLVTLLYPKKDAPSTFGSDNVTTHFTFFHGAGAQGEPAAPPAEGIAFLADDKQRDGFQSAAAGADKMIANYLELEKSWLGRGLSWDAKSTHNRQVAAQLSVDMMRSMKGLGAVTDSDIERYEKVMDNLTNPNKLASMKDEDQRRATFQTARQLLIAGMMRDYQSQKFLRKLPDGQQVLVSLEWKPRGLTPSLPRQVTTEGAEVSSRQARKLAASGSIDEAMRAAMSEIDRVSQNKSSDPEEVRLALQEGERTLAQVQGAQRGFAKQGPVPTRGRAAAIEAALKVRGLGDEKARKLQEELVEVRAQDTLRAQGQDPKRRASLERTAGVLKRKLGGLREHLKRVEAQAKARESREAAAATESLQHHPGDY